MAPRTNQMYGGPPDHKHPQRHRRAMRTITLVALVFLAAPFIRVAVQGSELRATYYTNGNPESRMEAHRNLQGELIRDGRVQLYHEDGSLKASGRYRDDVEDGRWEWYSPEGQLNAICEYTAGLGQYRDLAPDGRVAREGNVEGAGRVGVWREYWPSGRIRLEGSYLDNVQHGTWTAFSDEEPPRTEQLTFDHGQIVGPE